MEGAILQALVKLSHATTRIGISWLLGVAKYARHICLNMGFASASLLLATYFGTFSSLNQFILTLLKLLRLFPIFILVSLTECKRMILAIFGRGVLVDVVGRRGAIELLLLRLVHAAHRLSLLFGEVFLLAAALAWASGSVEVILRNVVAVRHLTHLLTVDYAAVGMLHLPLVIVHAAGYYFSLVK